MEHDVRDVIVRLLDATGLKEPDLAGVDIDNALGRAAEAKGGEVDYWWQLLRQKVALPEPRAEAVRAVARERA